MNKIGYIKLPLPKVGHFALLPYDEVERKLLGEEAFKELLDQKILLELAELTNEAVKDEK